MTTNKHAQNDQPTPETDAFFYRHGYPIEVDTQKAISLCERLEQERDEARRLLKEERNRGLALS